jgi:hypothetical protein
MKEGRIMDSTKRFVLRVEGCVEPGIVGPYKTAKLRDAKARKIRNDSGGENSNDGVFWLNVTDNGKVQVGAYSNGFMEGQRGFPGSED